MLQIAQAAVLIGDGAADARGFAETVAETTQEKPPLQRQGHLALHGYREQYLIEVATADAAEIGREVHRSAVAGAIIALHQARVVHAATFGSSRVSCV